jgi:hypothetical protein
LEQESDSVLTRMLEHMGCNCGENECFTEDEERAAKAELEELREKAWRYDELSK